MALYRRRRAMKKVSKSKRVVRRGLRRVRRAAPSIHKFKEMYISTPIQIAGVGTQGGVLKAAGLSSLTNVASFTGMFDLYKITGIKFKIMPRFNLADVTSSGANTNGLPYLYLATNRDPFVPAPTGVADILNDDTCRVYRCDKPISWYVKDPKPDMTVSVPNPGAPPTSAPFNFQFGVGHKWQPWLTTGGNGQTLSQIDVSHYGVRYLLDNQASTAPVTLDVYATLYFQCKEQD